MIYSLLMEWAEIKKGLDENFWEFSFDSTSQFKTAYIQVSQFFPLMIPQMNQIVKENVTTGCVNILAAFPYRGGFTPIDTSPTHIALRWSAATDDIGFYRYITPPA